MNVEDLMNKLTDAVAHQYRDDKTAAGVVISKIKSGYYCSVVRYSQSFAKGKEVICRAKASTMLEAVRQVSEEFVKKAHEVNPVDHLRHYLQGPSVLADSDESEEQAFWNGFLYQDDLQQY